MRWEGPGTGKSVVPSKRGLHPEQDVTITNRGFERVITVCHCDSIDSSDCEWSDAMTTLSILPSPNRCNQTLLGWLRDMCLIREFEIRTCRLTRTKIGGFCHVYIGRSRSGGCGRYPKHDPLVWRTDHGHGLARGMDPKYGMAEMFGKLAGCA